MNPSEPDILELERKYWQAVKAHDADTIASLSDTTCLVVGPQGIREFDPESISQTAQTMTYVLKSYEIDESLAEIVRVDENIAVVAYRVRTDAEMEGKKARTDAFDSSVWVRRGDTWVCAMHTETPVAA